MSEMTYFLVLGGHIVTDDPATNSGLSHRSLTPSGLVSNQKFMKIFQKKIPPPPRKKKAFFWGGGGNFIKCRFRQF